MSLKRFSGNWPALRVVLPGSRSCVCTCRVHAEPHPPPLDPKDAVRDEPPHVVQGELVRDRDDAREVPHGHPRDLCEVHADILMIGSRGKFYHVKM